MLESLEVRSLASRDPGGYEARGAPFRGGNQSAGRAAEVAGAERERCSSVGKDDTRRETGFFEVSRVQNSQTSQTSMIHLDTNFLIQALVSGTPQDNILRGWLRTGDNLGMSTIAWAELLCGPIERHHLELATVVVSERFPFLEEDSVLAARLFNESGRRRGSFTDCMIAATALRLQVPLATANISDFSGFKDAGLTILSG